MYYRSVLLVLNKVRWIAGQDHREITRVYTIYECRMQITVNPIGHFLRVRLCARELRARELVALAVVGSLRFEAGMDWLHVADNEL